MEQHEGWNKHLPWEPVAEFSSEALSGLRYEQLLPYAQPESGDAFRVVTADFVSTEDGTGIVHIAPSFGADDFRTAQQNGIGSLTLVDRQGKFSEDAGELAGRYVKKLQWTILNGKTGCVHCRQTQGREPGFPG